MTFFLGLVEGAAKAVDTQLRKDMDRTQERIDGMAQYRITRRRADLERKEKDKKELRDVLTQLASFTDGDEDKAIQLYNSAGKTIAGGNDLIAELRTNQKADVDVRSAIKFAEDNAEPGNFTDFIKRNITPVSSLPLIEGEMKASGLAGMFGRDIGKEVMQQVGEAAPISEEAIPEGMGRTAMATIDRSGFKEATAQAALVEERERAGRRFTMDEKRLVLETNAADLNKKRIEQAMQIATSQEERAKTKALSDEEQRKLDNARLEVQDLQRQSQLIQEAELHVLNVESKKLSIAEQQDAAKKRKEHPVFSSFEDMAVYATQKLATGNLGPNEEADFERLLKDAIKGANDYTAATSDPDGTGGIEFAKQSLDSIVKSSMSIQLDKVPSKSIGDRIKYQIEGNEAQYYGGVEAALQIAADRLTPEGGSMPPQAKRYIEGLQRENRQKMFDFASGEAEKYQTLKDANKSTDGVKFIPEDELEQKLNIIQQQSSEPLDLNAAMKRYALTDEVKIGTVFSAGTDSTGSPRYLIWTGSTFLQANSQGLQIEEEETEEENT